MQETKTYAIGYYIDNSPWESTPIFPFKVKIGISYQKSGFYPKVYNNQFMYDGVIELKKNHTND